MSLYDQWKTTPPPEEYDDTDWIEEVDKALQNPCQHTHAELVELLTELRAVLREEAGL